MSISSMTGFARADGAADGLTWAWEARSVNGRGLDVRLRLPPGFDALEPHLRESISKRCARGNISVSLALDRQNGVGVVRLNEAVLADILKAADRVAELTGGARPDTAALLTMKGVLEISDSAPDDAAARAVRDRVLMQSFESALDKFVEARRAEGARLSAIITDQVLLIEKLVADVRSSPSRTPVAIQQRLKELIGRLLETGETFEPERLHQEAVLAATRADVEEELARLETHVAAAREILNEAGAVGNLISWRRSSIVRPIRCVQSRTRSM